ncbi:MAG: hypothetical protein JXR78_13475 [Victivallales bacterium]|nr:hypothetical protein [Victivallales bacterium]
MSELNVLYIYSAIPHFTGAVRDYDCAFGIHSRHRISYFNADAVRLSFKLDNFDVIIFSFSFFSNGDFFMGRDLINKIADFKGVKIAIFQDEYDYLLRYRKILPELKLTGIITIVPEESIHKVYGDIKKSGVDFINALTGYVTDEAMTASPRHVPLEARSWHIGYRGRKVPFKYGRLTQEKYIIGREMERICAEHNIPANISVDDNDRIYGDAWKDFISNCRTVLGTESGSNVFDFDGTLVPKIQQFIVEHPDADFDTIEREFLKDREQEIRINQISPRIFEAISLKTGLVLFEGEYSGIIRPWEHYIPLKKDFSNIDQVLAAVNDLPRLEKMIESAYRDIIISGKYSYAAFIAKIDDYIEKKHAGIRNNSLPVLGIVAWRDADGNLKPCKNQSIDCPTSTPVKSNDHLAEPVLVLRLNMNALQRKMFFHYSRFSRSRIGHAVRDTVNRLGWCKVLIRKLVRTMTGRS